MALGLSRELGGFTPGAQQARELGAGGGRVGGLCSRGALLRAWLRLTGEVSERSPVCARAFGPGKRAREYGVEGFSPGLPSLSCRGRAPAPTPGLNAIDTPTRITISTLPKLFFSPEYLS